MHGHGTIMRMACYQPEIAGNMGAVLRFAACFGVAVDIVEPCGFVWSEPKMRRAGMDYAAHVKVARHHCFEVFRRDLPGRLILLSTRGTTALPTFTFAATDTLMLGSESSGVPADVAQACDASVRIPMHADVRSLNLAVSGAVAIYEALRQTGDLPR